MTTTDTTPITLAEAISRAPSPSPTPTVHGQSNQHYDEKTSSSETPAALDNQKVLVESPYPGSGTEQDPFVVGWLPGEKEDPYNWSNSYKWFQTALTAINTLCIAFASSAYSGATRQIYARFLVSEEVIILGISLCVLGFGVGPLLWAPLSEMYGRRPIFLVSYLPFALFHIGGACAQNIETILVTRFFAGTFGSAPLTNSGGTIADMWSIHERGTASALFALAPFLGPVLGPIVGGFTAESGWRNVFWVMFGFAMVTYIVSAICVPETYAPTLLRAKARKLQKESNNTIFYISKFDKINTKTKKEIFKINMTRPFVLLFKEPIVLCLSMYTAIVYGTLYLFFTAFPIVFQTTRGWSSGVGGLAFLGVGLGMLIGTALAPVNNKIYLRATRKSPTGRAPPEARLPMAMLGGALLPSAIFWFAFTSTPSVHWIVPILAGVPFGCGMLLVFSSIINYLIDCYLMYAASALAANTVLRSLLGAVFPLFSTYMYQNLGNAWASALVAFLSLACAPMPFLFYRYGAKIRARSKFSPNMPPAPPAPVAATASTSTENASKVAQPDSDSALEPEYAADAGLEEEKARQAELAKRKAGDQIV